MASDSIQSIDFDSADAKCTLIHVRLSTTIPVCCGVADGAYMEFHQAGQYERAELTLVEDRAGHLLEGSAFLPAPGTYGYRLVAKIVGKSVYRMGTFEKGGS